MRRAVGWLPLAHLLPLAVYLGVRGMITRAVPAWAPERAWWQLYDLVSLLNELTLFLFLPLPLWLVTALVARTRAAIALSVLPWAIFLALYGGLFLPRAAHLARPVAAGGAEMRLRVTTFNVLAVNRSYGGLVRTVRQLDPDILLVQELNWGLADALDGELAAAYPHRRLRPTARGRGAGIWSRHPIELEELWDRSRRGDRWQHAVIDTGGTRVHVVNLHLTAPALRWVDGASWPLPLVTGQVTQGRDNEVDDLIPLLQPLLEAGAPVIAAGDLNLTDQTPEYRRLLAAGLRDAHRDAGWGFGHTFPSVPVVRMFRRQLVVPAPLLRIDHIMYSSPLAVRRVETGPDSGGSDHLPVTAEFVIR